MNTEAKPNIIVICGPTGLGKTAVSIELALDFHGEIIGADSMQIYRYMDIGTAKPTRNEQAQVPHHLIDIVDPDDPFDAAGFAKMAGEMIMNLHAVGIVPFVVGGTGLYIKALVHGLSHAGPADTDIRKRLKEAELLHGPGFLYEKLSKCDQEAAERIHPNDTYRIIRALEVYEATGMAISQYSKDHGFENRRFNVLKIGLHIERETLYERINQRVDAMIAAGLVDEVKMLLNRGYSEDLKSMQSIGYRHMIDFIKGRITWEETVRTLKRDTRRYAKRQMTWFKADPEIVWAEPEQLDYIKEMIKNFLQGAKI
ncbi:MAG: tRNA (adenosine(37)-N6)-dimethylallyltransferase MiaA [Proteobacteria bacterium]|nr:tRNA (adenosine(37)-N6)-dimethylallyltransferase MiaA [Desulfobacteraceae bacterium]MBU4100769.1 tRNA (adenosine(37)-N6)-dimethylallyltransferase MiaA [Pseudomonadota bacterium]MBU4388201.1 tRNA (adenosine(37)-N6)-dimethylallyltransferase MiaA [Pseudomonadota bacterium]MBU4420073.1 tRNA (adenosine(37)-N6)-dimethylallyltransferase MiaA [Pseudomonadota bacterium]MCG2830575.1 tRNA (adenosine(37)-N6)-dimethylallyltransferase MiaA [Desulfobacteraceae bacterium]